MTGECLGQRQFCPIRRCRSVGHHLYYPKTAYPTELEQAWRNLPQNILQRCVCIEREDPHTTPPQKPSVEQMMLDLTVSLEEIDYAEAA